MPSYQLGASRIASGMWSASITGETSTPPAVDVTHLSQPLADVKVEGADGAWTVSVPIPAELLSDGILTFIVTETQSGQKLGQFTIVAGAPLDDDLRAEIDLLRAELDLLKKAFRRHCVETGA